MSDTDLHYIPEIKYLPSLARPRKGFYTASPNAKAWGEKWRSLHTKTAPFTDALRVKLEDTVRHVYALGAFHLKDVYFEFGDRYFLERLFFEDTIRFLQKSKLSLSDIEGKRQVDEQLIYRLYQPQVEPIETALTTHFKPSSAPSIRELFGEDGAEVSNLGLRMDPIVEAIKSSLQDTQKGLFEIIEGVITKPDAMSKPPTGKTFHYLKELTSDQLQFSRKLCGEGINWTFGNHTSGSFKKYAFFIQELGDAVDFSPFLPWLWLIENVQHIVFRPDFVVINPLPHCLKATKKGLRREWRVENGAPHNYLSQVRWHKIFLKE